MGRAEKFGERCEEFDSKRLFHPGPGSALRNMSDVDTRDERPELLRWLENGDRTRGNLYRGTSSRISGHPRFAISDFESAETADFDVFLPLQRFLDRVQERIHNPGTVLLGYQRAGSTRDLRRYALNEVCFGH